MKIVAFTDIREKGEGWLHEIEFDLDGQRLIISDDTDEVSVFADQKSDALIKQAVKLWAEYAFGCSHFPAVQVPSPLPTVGYDRSAPIWHGSGVNFSHIE